jgi:hypothetical protein
LALNDAELHESEDKLSEEDLLVAHEETALHPSVDGNSDAGSKVEHALIVVIVQLSVVDGLEEEGLERLKRVLVHVVNNAELDEHEIEHCALGGNSSVDLSGKVDLLLSLDGHELLLLDLGRGLLGDLERLDEGSVLQNGVWIGIGELLQEP